MKCPKCGLENRSDARFCKKCGQPLPVPPTPTGVVCPACGASAKPGARFCARCGRPLPTAPPPAPPMVRQAHQPRGGDLPSPAQPPPPAYAQPLAQPPPPVAPAAPGRRSSRWLWWVGGIVVFLCIVVLVVTGLKFGPDLLGGTEEPTATSTPTATKTPTETPPPETPTAPPPTETPTPAFDAQIGTILFTGTVRTGDLFTVTVTLTNTGDFTLSNLRYQLVGEWAPYLELAADEVVEHEGDVPPGTSDEAAFVLRAAQEGEATFQAYVLMDVRTDPPSAESLLSEGIVTVTIVAQ